MLAFKNERLITMGSINFEKLDKLAELSVSTGVALHYH